MGFQASEGLSGLNVQDRHFTWLAVDAGRWLGAYLGLVTSEPAHGSPWGSGFLQPGGWIPNGEVSRAFKRKKAKAPWLVAVYAETWYSITSTLLLYSIRQRVTGPT